MSCSVEDEGPVDNSPGSFEVNVYEVTDRSAKLSWTPSTAPGGQRISYTVLLEGENMDNSPFVTNYSFSGLAAETSYRGKVIASSESGDNEVTFSFTTGEFTPKIHNGYVMLTSQTEVDHFGAQGYNIINGTLGIESRYELETDITDLSPLKDLLEVKEDLRIRGSSLENLEGLNNLVKIGGDLSITYNSILSSLEGLEGLRTISGIFGMHSNPEIVDLEPLETAESMGEVRIGNNEKLKHIWLLPDALSVDHIYIYNNSSLEVIEGFEKVHNIKYDLEITGNPRLRTIPKFEDLTSINFGLYILRNYQLENIGFPKLEHITYNLEIMNTMASEITGFNELRYVGHSVLIWGNSKLSNFCNFLPLVTQGEVGALFILSDNSFNPSYEELKAGNCAP